jgi:hypothetical protein
MSYQALLHTAKRTVTLHVGTYDDCLEALARVGQAKGAPKRASTELRWQPEAVEVEAVNRRPVANGWWEEGE